MALAIVWTLSNACSAWHTTSLQPQRFNPETSPAQVRLTLNDGTQVTARHPVQVGDSLVWLTRSGGSPLDSARSVVAGSSIRHIEVREYDAPRSIALLVVVVGGVVGGVLAITHAIAASLD
jgi:hypothetical protein